MIDDGSTMDVSEERVRELVRDRCSPELEAHYVQLNNVLMGINFPIHLEELDMLFGLVCSQDIDNLTIVASVDKILRTALDRAFSTIGVEFTSDIGIEMLVEAAEQLLQFDPTDNPILIANDMQDTEDDIDALIKLLVRLGTYEYEHWMEVVVEVSDAFTSNLLKICYKADEEQNSGVVEPSLEHAILGRVGRLLKDHGNTFAADLISHNVGIGASLESLYQVHVGRFIDMPPDTAVGELYALAAMSGESFESAQRIIGHCLDDLIVDMQDRGRAERLRPEFTKTFQPIFGAE